MKMRVGATLVVARGRPQGPPLHQLFSEPYAHGAPCLIMLGLRPYPTQFAPKYCVRVYGLEGIVNNVRLVFG
jgi:hypothetical protein